MMDKVLFTCVYILHRLNPLLGTKTRLFFSPFLISTSWFLILAGAFRNEHVAAGSTTLRSATEENESGGYVTVPCTSKVIQRSSTGDWLKF